MIQSFKAHEVDYLSVKQDYTNLYELYKKLDHRFNPNHIEESLNKKHYNPDGYIIFTYNGAHYELVSYNDQIFFKTAKEIPKKIFDLIKIKCNKVGKYKKISDFK